MSVEFIDASNEAIEVANNVIGAPPFSVAMWINPIDLSGTQAWFAVSDQAQTSQQHVITTNGTAVNVRSRNTTFRTAVATGTVTVGNWHHICGVWASSASRSAYFDGGGKGTETTSVTDPVLTHFGVARYNDSSPGTDVNGRIAHVAAWTVALTDAEVALLALGMSPLKVRPASLVGYWPMHNFNGSVAIDVVGGNTFDIVHGTPTSSVLAPRVFMPSAQILQFPPAAGGGVFSVSLSEAIDPADSYSAIGILAGSVSEPADVSDSQSVTMIGQGSVSEPVDPAETYSGLLQTLQSVTETVDLSDSQAAIIVQVVSLTENVDASDSYTSLARAAAAITEAADLGESWAATAVRVASLTETVDLTDTWTGTVPLVLASIAEDVTAAATFGAAMIARPSLTEQVDLTDAYSVILNAAASLTEQVDPADIQSALMVAGASFSEAVELAAVWLGTVGEIAAAVQILVAARDRRLVAEPRDTLVIVKTRPRRIVVNKLN